MWIIKKLKRIFTLNIPVFLRATLIKMFSFLYPMLRIRPYLASLNVTDNCCLKCVMCNEWENSHPGELSTDQWKDILSQLRVCGVRDINLTGGEPLMRKDLAVLAQHATSLGLTVGVTTNGYLLTKEKVRELMGAGVKTISVSMDAVGDDYDRIRGVPGAYQKLYAACEILSEYKRKGQLSVFLSFLLMKDTLEYYQRVVEVAKGFDLPVAVNLFDVAPYFFKKEDIKDKFWVKREDQKALKTFQECMIKNKETVKQFSYHSFSEINYFADYFVDPLQKNLPCTASQVRICIDPQGNVFGGCWAMGTYGNLKEQRLREVVESEKYRKVHKNMFFKKCPGCACGYPMNLRYSARHLCTEMRYRISPKTRKGIYTPSNDET
ncbi:MAG: radical SAM protein [Candidatus Omnitrophica bacterium]|nr:radical SAM protein [Candidatus Omnitrophota bacterium]